MLLCCIFDILKSLVAVDVWLASSEEIEVGPVNE